MYKRRIICSECGLTTYIKTDNIHIVTRWCRKCNAKRKFLLGDNKGNRSALRKLGKRVTPTPLTL